MKWPWARRREEAAPTANGGVVRVRFVQRYTPPAGAMFTRGEVATFPDATAATLIRHGIAKRVKAAPPPRPPAPPGPLVPVRFVTRWRMYQRHEVAAFDPATADELIAQGLAVVPDAPLPPEPPITPTSPTLDLLREVLTAVERDGWWAPEWKEF